MAGRVLASASMALCRSQKHHRLSYFLLNHIISTTGLFGGSALGYCRNEFGTKTDFGGVKWIHSGQFLNKIGKAVEQPKHSRNGVTVVDGSGDEKAKRVRPKGKRAVLKWLKFFRWKKKKQYQRMVAEEKIIYKLKKARNKEERLVAALKKVEPAEYSEATHDPEILTPEEHHFFLKMGLKCKNYVPVGRRGIYQGVILNMHLHWKKHQTLQVIVKTFLPEEVKEMATELARLTGGIVLDIHEENTIIMYRGKNYVQPPTEIMSPKVTLSRKKALDKSIFRDGLRAVRKYIPRLEQELVLLQEQATRNADDAVEQIQRNGNTNAEGSKEITNLQSEKLDKLKEDTKDEKMVTDSEGNLSDIFETDSETEPEEKTKAPLYLDNFDKFPVETIGGEAEDFEDHLPDIFTDSRNAKAVGKSVYTLKLDEVDKMFLQAASLLKRKRNK